MEGLGATGFAPFVPLHQLPTRLIHPFFDYYGGAHKAARPVVQLRGHRRLCRLGASLLPNTAPMKCPRGPVPWAVARGIVEAVTDQEMACLLFAQELSGVSR